MASRSSMKGHSEPKTGISIQNVSGRNKRPSKFKVIEPSKLEDLVKHLPDKYRMLDSNVSNHITDNDSVKLVFVNREEIWVHVAGVDHEEGTLTGSIQTKCTKLEGLQIGQLVCFKKEHIVEVHEESGSDDDDW